MLTILSYSVDGHDAASTSSSEENFKYAKKRMDKFTRQQGEDSDDSEEEMQPPQRPPTPNSPSRHPPNKALPPRPGISFFIVLHFFSVPRFTSHNFDFRWTSTSSWCYF
jgi:hypothetical protein